MFPLPDRMSGVRTNCCPTDPADLVWFTPVQCSYHISQWPKRRRRIHEEPLIVQEVEMCKNIDAQVPFRRSIVAVTEHAGPEGPVCFCRPASAGPRFRFQRRAWDCSWFASVPLYIYPGHYLGLVVVTSFRILPTWYPTVPHNLNTLLHWRCR